LYRFKKRPRVYFNLAATSPRPGLANLNGTKAGDVVSQITF
jgi:hypothetical protein